MSGLSTVSSTESIRSIAVFCDDNIKQTIQELVNEKKYSEALPLIKQVSPEYTDNSFFSDLVHQVVIDINKEDELPLEVALEMVNKITVDASAKLLRAKIVRVMVQKKIYSKIVKHFNLPQLSIDDPIFALFISELKKEVKKLTYKEIKELLRDWPENLHKDRIITVIAEQLAIYNCLDEFNECQESLDSDEWKVTLQLNVADAKLKNGESISAIEWLEKVPQNLYGERDYKNLLLALAKNHCFDEALQLLEQLSNDLGDISSVKFEIANEIISYQLLNKAKEFIQSLDNNHEKYSVVSNLVNSLLANQDFEGAIQVALSNPNSCMLQLDLMKIAKELICYGKLEEAKDLASNCLNDLAKKTISRMCSLKSELDNFENNRSSYNLNFLLDSQREEVILLLIPQIKQYIAKGDFNNAQNLMENIEEKSILELELIFSYVKRGSIDQGTMLLKRAFQNDLKLDFLNPGQKEDIIEQIVNSVLDQMLVDERLYDAREFIGEFQSYTAPDVFKNKISERLALIAEARPILELDKCGDSLLIQRSKIQIKLNRIEEAIDCLSHISESNQYERANLLLVIMQKLVDQNLPEKAKEVMDRFNSLFISEEVMDRFSDTSFNDRVKAIRAFISAKEGSIEEAEEIILTLSDKEFYLSKLTIYAARQKSPKALSLFHALPNRLKEEVQLEFVSSLIQNQDIEMAVKIIEDMLPSENKNLAVVALVEPQLKEDKLGNTLKWLQMISFKEENAILAIERYIKSIPFEPDYIQDAFYVINELVPIEYRKRVLAILFAKFETFNEIFRGTYNAFYQSLKDKYKKNNAIVREIVKANMIPDNREIVLGWLATFENKETQIQEKYYLAIELAQKNQIYLALDLINDMPPCIKKFKVLRIAAANLIKQGNITSAKSLLGSELHPYQKDAFALYLLKKLIKANQLNEAQDLLDVIQGEINRNKALATLAQSFAGRADFDKAHELLGNLPANSCFAQNVISAISIAYAKINDFRTMHEYFSQLTNPLQIAKAVVEIAPQFAKNRNYEQVAEFVQKIPNNDLCKDFRLQAIRSSAIQWARSGDISNLINFLYQFTNDEFQFFTLITKEIVHDRLVNGNQDEIKELISNVNNTYVKSTLQLELELYAED